MEYKNITYIVISYRLLTNIGHGVFMIVQKHEKSTRAEPPEHLMNYVFRVRKVVHHVGRHYKVNRFIRSTPRCGLCDNDLHLI